ncbi:MAG: cyclic diguanylate phosphodiesterase [Frankiales bacterium]|nr:cyclic diguanylate phosphodiesterase [Frankiales bacterium]
MPVTSNRLRLVVTACAVLAAAVPVLLSLAYARHDARGRVQERARIYAAEVLHRSDSTAAQAQSAVDRLSALPGDPCSASHLALMREIDVDSSYLQAVGHVEGGRLTCSSLGEGGAPLPLGPVTLTSPAGAELRTDVRLSQQGPTFVVVEEHGYAAVLHKQLPLDVANDTGELSIATFSIPSGIVLTQRGEVSADAIRRSARGRVVTLVEDGRATAVAGSKKWYIGTVAALAPAALHREEARSRRLFLPIGLLLGLALAALVLLLGRRRLGTAAGLRAALRSHEFYLEYQPVVDLQTADVIGAEALLRWRRPDGQRMRPDVFLAVAEDVGLMPQITRRVLELVRADWDRLTVGRQGFHLAVNVSAKDIDDAPTVELLTRLRDLRNGSIIIEVTESSVLDRQRAAAVLSRLRSCGLQVAIDDFGTGYSSLSYLQTLPVDYLKIDKSFVDSVGVGAATSNVAVHIIDMARALDLRLIAEGVETEEQASFLRSHSVQYAQGWLFGRPVGLDSWPWNVAPS